MGQLPIELVMKVYYEYEETGKGNFEMRPLSYELLSAGVMHWLDHRYNLIWLAYKALHYPFLLGGASRNDRRPERKLLSFLQRDASAQLKKSPLKLGEVCATTAFLNSFFLHFAGADTDMPLVDRAAASWRDLESKLLMRRRFPALYGWLWRLRHRPPGPPREGSDVPDKYYKDERILRAIVGDGGLVVRGGPFAGMRYVSRPYGGAFYPKLLGSYEAELHGMLARALESRYHEVINIGCGEGYYAVGLSLRLPDARVHAFDTSARARRLCARLARLNGVAGRVAVSGACTHRRLDELTGRRALFVCDCEGCELELLRPELVPGLTRCDLLIELHDFVDRCISRTITARFAATHDITLVSSVTRDPSAYPSLNALSPEDRLVAVAEGRPETMQWAFMTAKGGSEPALRPRRAGFEKFTE